MTKEWREIEGYEGKYEISNHGEIKSYAQTKDGRLIGGYIDAKGYNTVHLYDTPQHGTRHKIHRLVASTFIDNPNNYPQVNHKDENKLNNRVDNLEWCDNDYNARYGTKGKRAGEKNRCCEITSSKIYSVDSTGHIDRYDSIGEAERVTGLSHCNIVRTLKGRTKHCGGYEWHYENS